MRAIWILLLSVSLAGTCAAQRGPRGRGPTGLSVEAAFTPDRLATASAPELIAAL